jgi:hypothetical protein
MGRFVRNHLVAVTNKSGSEKEKNKKGGTCKPLGRREINTKYYHENLFSGTFGRPRPRQMKNINAFSKTLRLRALVD